MSKSERELISERRRLLENPYAHIEQLAEPSQAFADHQAASPEVVAAGRKLLENPYAYLGEAGKYEALATLSPNENKASLPSATAVAANSLGARKSSATRPYRSDDEIEAKVREIHALIWRERAGVWTNGVPSDPIDLLDPAVALRLLGYDFQLEEGLGQMRGASGPIEVAGLIDTKAKVVRVARQFPNSVRSFTAAHELAHAVLHPSLGVLHRDKALDGAPASGDRVEVEANKFATLFLMPAKLVRTRFAELFLAERFGLTEETSFAIAGQSLSDLQQSYRTQRDLSRLLASAERYNGRHFTPLHEQFHVSREAMSIRLEELALVD